VNIISKIKNYQIYLKTYLKDKMNKYFDIIKIIIFLLGGIIIFGILVSGCEKIRCYPQFDVNKGYIGFKCGGEF